MERNILTVKGLLRSPAFSFLLRTLVAAGLLYGLSLYIDAAAVVASLRTADPSLLAAGFLLVAANTGVHFLRWRYLLRLVSPDVSNAEVLTSLLVGFTAGFFTPAQVGEFAGRIASSPGVRRSRIVGMTLIDKAYLLAATVLTGVPSLALFVSLFYPGQWNSAYSAGIILFVTAVVALASFPERSIGLLRRLPERVRSHRFFSIFGVMEDGFRDLHGRVTFLYSLALYAVIALQFALFINAFEPVAADVSVIGSFSVYFVKAVILPVSIGDLGVRESASVFFFAKYGVSAAAAFNASLCMFLANILLPSAAGALLVLRLRGR